MIDTADRGRLRPAAFLDRDGVINLDVGYAFRPEQLAFTPTAAEGIRLFNAAGWLVIVVTNQSGVARGLYGVAEVEAFHRHMQARLAESGAYIDAFYYAPWHPDGIVAEWAMAHEDRKPGAGMIERAIREWPVDRNRSVLIGDKERDVAAARAAGIAGIKVVTDACDLAAEAKAIIARTA